MAAAASTAGRAGAGALVTAYDWAFRNLATRVDAERAHDAASKAIRVGGPAMRRRGEKVRARATPVMTMGLTFAGRLGLAAGFDKNARGIDGLAALGFGHVEIGTVTGEPQPGNERPRLFRLPDDAAILNRMGFNNDGAEVVARRLAQRAERRRDAASSLVLGVNIGKTRSRPRAGRRRLREERRAARSPRRLPRGQRLLAQHPRPARPASRGAPRAAARRRTTSRGRGVAAATGAAAGQDRPRPRRRGRRRRGGPGPQPGARRRHRDKHHDLARGPGHRPRPTWSSSAPGESAGSH